MFDSPIGDVESFDYPYMRNPNQALKSSPPSSSLSRTRGPLHRVLYSNNAINRSETIDTFASSQREVSPSFSFESAEPEIEVSDATSISDSFVETKESEKDGGNNHFSPAMKFLSSFHGNGSLNSLITNGSSSFGPEDGEEEVGGWKLGRTIGWGGFSVVREGRRGDEKVAVKVVKKEKEKEKAGGGIKINWAEIRGRDRSTSSPIVPGLELLSTSAPADPLVVKAANLPLPSTNFSSLSLNLPLSLPTPTPSPPPSSQRKPHALSKEISIWSTLHHPQIVELKEVIEGVEATYIIMPLCGGGSLLDWLNRGGEEGKRGNGRDDWAPEGRDNKPKSSIKGKRIVTDPIPISSKPYLQLKKSKGLPLAEVRKIFAQIVEGVRYLHEEAGVVHKDLKLENVLSDEEGRWRVGDFGLAEMMMDGGWAEVVVDDISSANHPHPHSHSHKSHTLNPNTGHSHFSSEPGLSSPSLLSLAPSSSSSSSSILSLRRTFSSDVVDLIPPSATAGGSLAYSSPEQIRSHAPIVHPSTDVWSLGCVLYALVEGRLPFEDSFAPRLQGKILKGVWKAPDALELVGGGGWGVRREKEKRDLGAVLRGCLEVDVGKRWTVGMIARSEWLKEDCRRVREGLFDYDENKHEEEDGLEMMIEMEDEDEREGRVKDRGSPTSTFRRPSNSSRSRSSQGPPKSRSSRSSLSPISLRPRSSSRKGSDLTVTNGSNDFKQQRNSSNDRKGRSTSRGSGVERALRFIGLKTLSETLSERDRERDFDENGDGDVTPMALGDEDVNVRRGRAGWDKIKRGKDGGGDDKNSRGNSRGRSGFFK